MPKPVILPPTDKTPEEIAQAILNYRRGTENVSVPKDSEQSDDTPAHLKAATGT